MSLRESRFCITEIALSSHASEDARCEDLRYSFRVICMEQASEVSVIEWIDILVEVLWLLQLLCPLRSFPLFGYSWAICSVMIN